MISANSQESRYLSQRMYEVSRSFALVVQCLEEPLNHHMATAYLLCRVADNIEDCGQPPSWQQQRFAEFHHLLANPTAATTVLARWDQAEWPGLTTNEARMMGAEGGLPLWDIYAAIDERSRRSIMKWVSTMAEGMARIDDTASAPRVVHHNGVSFLADVSDYNKYCFYVAGTVGHMATELVSHHYGFSPELTAELSALSEACGRSLQKTNIVKDFSKDLGRGVSYLPGTWLEEVDFAPLSLQGAKTVWTQKVIDNVVDELRTATEYVLALPVSARGYRMASLLCLLPAYQTLLMAAKRQASLFTSQHQVKISRPTMAKCGWDAQMMVSDNDAIGAYGRRLEAEIDATFEAT
jgi:farnesyl-diphosphate farnesyltransferase